MSQHGATTSWWTFQRSQQTLIAAAIYNLAWGALVVLAPGTTLGWLGLPAEASREIWQCLGMVVGVYGIGYAIAASDPDRHWPIVLVGLVGKVLGPIGFVVAALEGRLPWRFGWLNVTNDLIWWIPFGLVLWHAAREAQREEAARLELAARQREELLSSYQTQQGDRLDELMRRGPLLLVFLRHAGCTFCRETLADLRRQRKRIEQAGTQIAIVHMSDEGEAAEMFRHYQVEDLPRISDPECRLYRAYGLGRGSWRQLLGPKVWWRGFKSALVEGHGFAPATRNVGQMPGVFLLEGGRVVHSFRHDSPADRPDYGRLATQCDRSRATG